MEPRIYLGVMILMERRGSGEQGGGNGGTVKGLSTSIVPTSICLSRPLSSSVPRPCAAAASPSRVPCEPKKDRQEDPKCWLGSH